MNSQILEKNLACIPPKIASLIRESELPSPLTLSKSGDYTWQLDGVFLHSQHDPKKEAERLAKELPQGKEKRVFLLMGVGLGHILNPLLQKENADTILIERYPFILKACLSLEDYSTSLSTQKLQILLFPLDENDFSDAFRGRSTVPISFVPHRGSLQWKEKEYSEIKHTAEQMFHKKDVNIATLTRFEKIWAKNILFNLPELSNLLPIHKLFGIASECKVVVACAGPSLFDSLDEIRKYREHFLLISVDTALPVLISGGVDPDLVYSVDPQALNSQYLESYQGKCLLVFDPTSTYLSLRLKKGPKPAFVASTPFPLINLLKENAREEIGSVPFGGSVSTNACSLGELMGATRTFIVGQDLAFTEGLAHAKGAILEERLNFLESRKFRRELHNYRQIYALPQKQVSGKKDKTYITNEKMLIFKKWFEDHATQNHWTNLTKSGARLLGIPESTFSDSFFPEDIQLAKQLKEKIVRIVQNSPCYFEKEQIQKNLEEAIVSLNSFSIPLQKGVQTSKRIYNTLRNKEKEWKHLSQDLKIMDQLDEEISNKKGLNDTLSLGIQRIIYSVTENFDSYLTPEEKASHDLAVAKKSLVLYEGLWEACQRLRKQMKKTLLRLRSF